MQRSTIQFPPLNQKFHKSQFLQKLSCQKPYWDQARLSSLINKQVATIGVTADGVAKVGKVRSTIILWWSLFSNKFGKWNCTFLLHSMTRIYPIGVASSEIHSKHLCDICSIPASIQSLRIEDMDRLPLLAWDVDPYVFCRTFSIKYPFSGIFSLKKWPLPLTFSST